jgi:hypothetical protein
VVTSMERDSKLKAAIPTVSYGSAYVHKVLTERDLSYLLSKDLI